MPKTTTEGIIEPDVLYRADEICERLGWSRRAFDAARRRGLDRVLHKYGKRNYALGRDVIAHITADRREAATEEVAAS